MTIYITNHAGLVLDRYTPPKAVRGLILVIAAVRHVYRAVAGALRRKDLGLGKLQISTHGSPQASQAALWQAEVASQVHSALVNLGMNNRSARATVERALEGRGGKASFEMLLRASLARVPRKREGFA